jgi:hypothetical protein
MFLIFFNSLSALAYAGHTVYIHNKPVYAEIVIKDHKFYFPLPALQEKLTFEVKTEGSKVWINGEELRQPALVLNGDYFIPLEEFAAKTGLQYSYNEETGFIDLYNRTTAQELNNQGKVTIFREPEQVKKESENEPDDSSSGIQFVDYPYYLPYYNTIPYITYPYLHYPYSQSYQRQESGRGHERFENPGNKAYRSDSFNSLKETNYTPNAGGLTHSSVTTPSPVATPSPVILPPKIPKVRPVIKFPSPKESSPWLTVPQP